MKTRFLNVSIASIRFDKVPIGVTSDVFDRTVLPLYGDILEWDYTLRRYISQGQLERKVSRDLSGKVGEEILRLERLGLFPVLFVQFFSWEIERIRIEVACATLQRFAKNERGIVMSLPSNRSNDKYTFELTGEFVGLLARYGFSMEICMI